MERTGSSTRGSSVRRLLAAALLLAAPPASAAVRAPAHLGIATNFVEVVLDRVDMGVAYDLAERQGTPFTVTNRGDVPMAVRVDPQAPPRELLKPGYEPVPDAGWVTVEPARFTLNPGETKVGSVSLAVPVDPRWEGRHFQAALWAHTDRRSMAVGVRSRLCFSIGVDRPAPPPPPAEPPLAFEPSSLSIEDAEAGTAIDLLKWSRAEIVLHNPGAEARVVRLRSVYVARGTELPAGYVPAPNPDFLRLAAADVTLAPDERRSVPLSLEVPTGAAHAGRRYAFLVRAEPVGRPGASGTMRIFVKLKE